MKHSVKTEHWEEIESGSPKNTETIINGESEKPTPKEIHQPEGKQTKDGREVTGGDCRGKMGKRRRKTEQ